MINEFKALHIKYIGCWFTTIAVPSSDPGAGGMVLEIFYIFSNFSITPPTLFPYVCFVTHFAYVQLNDAADASNFLNSKF